MVPSHLAHTRHGPAASSHTSARHASRSARQGLVLPKTSLWLSRAVRSDDLGSDQHDERQPPQHSD
eukprot:2994912-Prymnesium_polylepis.1